MKRVERSGFVWKRRAGFHVAAEVVGAAVEKIIATEGECSPERLVDEARPASSPLHALFEWNDGAAAELWRSHQARRVLASIRIRVLEEPEDDPVYVSVHVARDDEDGRYVRLRDATADPASRAALVAREWAQIRGWLERTSWVAEFAPLRDAVPAVEALLAPAAGEEPLAAAAD
jgi:hypothetical protein